MKAVDIKQISTTELMMEWAGGSTNDMIADSVLALLFGMEHSRATFKSMLPYQCRPFNRLSFNLRLM